MSKKYEVILQEVGGPVIHQGIIKVTLKQLATYLRKVASTIAQQGEAEGDED